MGRNRQVKIEGQKQNFSGFKDGVEFRIYHRRFKDRHGKVRQMLSGPGLRILTRKPKSA